VVKVDGPDEVAAKLAACRLGFVLLDMPDLGPSYSQVVQRFVHDALVEAAFSGRITHYAWEDQHPEGTDLAAVAAAEVGVAAEERGVEVTFLPPVYGQRWVRDEDGHSKPGPFGWMVEAIITGRVVR
jgi:hypothetical protein